MADFTTQRVGKGDTNAIPTAPRYRQSTFTTLVAHDLVKASDRTVVAVGAPVVKKVGDIKANSKLPLNSKSEVEKVDAHKPPNVINQSPAQG